MKQEYTDLPEEVVELLDNKTGFVTSPELLNAKHRLASILEDEKKAKEILRKLESTKGKWLNVRPTEPGYYWASQEGHKWIAHVWSIGSSLTSQVLYADENRLDGSDYDDVLWWTERLHPPEG